MTHRNWLAAAVLAAACIAPPAFAQAPAGDPEGVLVEELVVNAPVRGPAWWTVRDADSTVYILAIPSLAPDDLPFDSAMLERRLEGANRLILAPQLEPHPIRLAAVILGGRKKFLADPKPMSAHLPPGLRARYLARLAAIGEKPDAFDDVKPAFAGFVLAASDGKGSAHIGLGGISEQVEKIARSRQHPPRIQKLDGYDLPSGLKGLIDLPRAGQEYCLDAGLRQAEAGLGGVRATAERWAAGDAKGLAASDRGFGACLAAIPAVAAEIRRGIDHSSRAIEAALKQPGKSVALVEFRPLLAQGGVLDRLRARGYVVKAPGE